MKQIILIVLLALSNSIFAQPSPQSIKWGTDVWANFTERDGSGFYHELLSEIFKEPQYIMSVEYFPWKRTLKNLATGNIDMTGALPQNTAFYQSEWPLLTEDVYLVSRKGEYLTKDALANKVGAYRAGYESDIFYVALPRNAKGIPVNDPEQAVSLLKKGKIDYYVDIHSIVSPLLLSESMSSETKDADSSFTTSKVGNYKLYWSFVMNERGKQLKRHFDSQLKTLKDSGKLSRLYAKYALHMPQQQ